MRFPRAVLYLLIASPFAAAALASGCSSDNNNNNTTNSTSSGSSSGSSSSSGAGGGSGGGGTGGGTSTSSGTTTSSGTGGAVPVGCQGHIYECGDAIDNDGDGLVDWQDPDCLGPCDNTENSFYGGIPGQAGPACGVDCYFDQDSGSGNDNCFWDHRCDDHEVAPNYYPESVNGSKCEYNPDPNYTPPSMPVTCDQAYNTQSQTCLDFCGPLTPNGCDCFGCCNLPAGSEQWVWLGSEDADGNGKCTLTDILDPNKCEPCKPVAACLNGCGHCELCIGKDELPADCFPQPDAGTGGAGGSPPVERCPSGIQPCGLPGEDPCAAGYYCITGCCQEVPK